MPSCNVHLQNRVFPQKHRLLWELLLPNIVCMSQSVQVLRFLCLSYRCQVGDLQDVPLPRQGQHFDLISLPRKADSLVAWLTFFSHKEQRSKTGECGNHWCCWFSPDASTWDAKACRLAKPAKPQLWQVLATLRHRSNLPQAIADYSSPRSLTLTVLHLELLLSLVWRTKWHGVFASSGNQSLTPQQKDPQAINASTMCLLQDSQVLCATDTWCEPTLQAYKCQHDTARDRAKTCQDTQALGQLLHDIPNTARAEVANAWELLKFQGGQVVYRISLDI